MDKLGEWVQPASVVVGGSQHLHGIRSGVRLSTTQGTFTIGVTDAPVVSFGIPNGYPIPTNTTADFSYGLSLREC